MKPKTVETLSQFSEALLQRFPDREEFIAAADHALKGKIDPAYGPDSRHTLFRILHQSAGDHRFHDGTAELQQTVGQTKRAGPANERSEAALASLNAVLKDIGSIYLSPAKKSEVMADLEPVLFPMIQPVLEMTDFLPRPGRAQNAELVA